MKIKVFDSKTLKNVIEINLALVTRVQNECVIGRSPESGIVLDSPDVSRMHGKFLLENGSYYFCDLGSRNGSLINGRIAETSHKYLLNIGDTIRLGEFVLILEDVNPQPEYIAETVYRSFDATVVSDLRANVDLGASAVNQVPEVVSNVLEPIISLPEEVTIYQEATNVQYQQVSVDDDIVETPQETAQVVEVVGQPTEKVELADASENINQIIESQTTPISDGTPIIESSSTTPVFAEITEVVSNVPELVTSTPQEATIYQEVTYIQYQQVLVSEDIVETPQETRQVAEAVGQPTEKVELADASENIHQIIESETTPISDDTSIIESSLTTPGFEEIIEDVNNFSEAIISTPEEVAIYQEVTHVQHQQVSVDDDIVETPQVTEAVEQPIEKVELADASDNINQIIELETTPISDVTPIIESPTTPIFTEVTEIVSNVPEPIISTPEEVALYQEVTHVQHQQISVDDDVVETPQVAEAVGQPIEKVELADASDHINQIIELETTPISDVTPIIESSPIIPDEEITPPSESCELKEEIIETKKPEIISTKYIALIAHDSKRWELAEFVTKHQEFFLKCLTIAPLPVSEILSSQSSITITEKTSATTSGGYQTIAAKVASGDILAVIFLRDFLQAQSGVANEEAMLRVCNINQIMVATNLSTAEAIVGYIQFCKSGNAT